MVVTMINISPEEASELVNDLCFADADIEASPNSFIIVSYYIVGDDPTDVALVDENNRLTCSQEIPRNVPRNIAGYVASGSHRSIDTSADFAYFTHQVQSHIDGIALAFAGYASGVGRRPPPTAAP
jgi:hypothetical protein